jgi:hypothetical protein
MPTWTQSSDSHPIDFERQDYLKLTEKYRREGRLDDALRIGLEALNRWPQCSRVGCALGFLYYDRNELDNAIKQFEKVISFDPGAARAHIGLGTSILASGKDGWSEFAWRWKLDHGLGVDLNCMGPKWDGNNAIGKTLLVLGEGYGDTFQFMRYLPQVESLCDRLIVICTEETGYFVRQQLTNGMAPPFNQASKSSRTIKIAMSGVVHRWDNVPDYDVYCILGDMVGIVRRIGSFTAPYPYVKIDAMHSSMWKCVLEEVSSLSYRVGLFWTGNPQHANNFRRSIDFDLLSSLFDIQDIAFVSLQKGEPKKVSLPQFIDLSLRIDNFEDTSAIIDNLDLVITIDSSVAHLAGAMGKPVWMMLPYAPEWRWPRRGSTTAWYPSMRLFRQSRPGDWLDVIDAVRNELERSMKGDRGGDPALNYGAGKCLR